MDKLKELEEVYKEIVKNQFNSEAPVVFGEGKRNPYIMLIGEAPGQKEEETGRPFVGTAGKNLDEFLDILEIKREDIYITNVVKIRPFKINPSTGRKSNRTPTKGEVKASIGVLLQQIEEIKPTIVVTLGNTPLKAIEGKDDIRIGDLHGESIEKEGYILFPLYHPASIIYNRKLYDTYLEDLYKLKKLLIRQKVEDKILNSNFEEFKSFINGKTVGVVGIGVSNKPVIKQLIYLGANVVACDRRDDIGEEKEELESMGVKVELGNNYLESIPDCQVVFRSPSMRPDNPYLEKARNNGALITSEIEQFLRYCPAKVIGVTGSDGKTTTTTLINEMLRASGYNTFLGGNIGDPLLYRIEDIKPEDYVVVELSSFQLMECKYSPQIAIVTNLSPNHLDIHKDMQEYVNAKKNIFLNQDDNGITVLNMDNEITFDMRGEPGGTVRMFSTKNDMAKAYVKDGKMYANDKFICAIDDVALPGMHNIENLLAAFCAVYDIVTIEAMREVSLNFKGVEHRIEYVREYRGIKFYNDSIASSPTRVIAGLKYFKNERNKKVILIAGGYDKKIPFDELATEGLDKIKMLILIGVTKGKIRNAFEEKMKNKNEGIPIIDADSLEDAVINAVNQGEPGDIVTLSPACAAFDMFKNFEERGKKYKEIVNNLK